MSSFGLRLSELLITPKSPNTPSKTGRMLNGALSKSIAHQTDPIFSLCSQKVYCSLQEQFRHTWYLPREKKPSCYILSLQIHLPESPFLGQSKRPILTQVKDCVIRQHNNALECKEKIKTSLTPCFSPPSSTSTFSVPYDTYLSDNQYAALGTWTTRLRHARRTRRIAA
jgi:hypothetical protein